MQQNSLLDTLLSLLSKLSNSSPLGMLPYLSFHLAGLWLGMVGWKRHRAIGFLLVLAASFIGVASILMFMAAYSGGSDISPDHARLALVASNVGIIAAIFSTAATWHFVYRVRFAPPEPTPQ